MSIDMPQLKNIIPTIENDISANDNLAITLGLSWGNLEYSCYFYRKIYLLETLLRQQINKQFTVVFGSDWLDINSLKINFNEKDKKKIEESLTRIIREGLLNHHLVENMTFGFWAGLFHRHYHRQIWENSNMVAKVFPHFANKQKSFHSIDTELNLVRKLRNKICHFADITSENRLEIDIIIDKYLFGICGKNNKI